MADFHRISVARAHRIGQARVQTAYETHHERHRRRKILTLQEKKRAAIDAALGSEEPLMNGLTTEELEEVLSWQAGTANKERCLIAGIPLRLQRMSVKEQLLQAINRLPSETSFRDVTEEIAFLAAMKKGEQELRTIA